MQVRFCNNRTGIGGEGAELQWTPLPPPPPRQLTRYSAALTKTLGEQWDEAACEAAYEVLVTNPALLLLMLLLLC